MIEKIGQGKTMEYRIGTRGSRLALAQARGVCKRLAEAYPEDRFEIQVVKTKGDLVLDKPLHEIGDKDVFVKEIEEKLLSGEIQIGVHSMKDMPAFPAPGLLFAKPWKREDPRDALILRRAKSLDALREGAVIGTGSKRRELQLKRLRPDLHVVGIRGNVDTRLRKMEEEGLDGILLAAAGLRRLGMEARITQYLEAEEMIPAPAQGILALEIREGEGRLLSMLDVLSDEETALAAEAERGFLQRIGGSCHIPVGAICQKTQDGRWKMNVMFGDESGERQAYGTVYGSEGAELAEKAADLIQQQMREKNSCKKPAGESFPGLSQKSEEKGDALSQKSEGKGEALSQKSEGKGEALSQKSEEKGDALSQKMEEKRGMVTLVGAGPGDPGLITVKGLQAIQEAGCIVYDRLASPKLLEAAKDSCKMVYVGKASHNHTMPQEEINRLLLQKSREYERVVRLKGGDVYVFGRGGEEGLFLQEHGVPFEVVPGVSSCTAGLAYAGIPITHRGIAQGFHVVTAHSQGDELAEIDFAAMARGKETCVFLMGLSKVGEIADRLLGAGMPGTVAAAVISHATTPRQRTCISDLAHIAQETERAGLESPAMIVVGEVVSLRERLDFFERRPLFGRRCLIPKIGAEPTRLQELLQQQGAEACEIQVGEIARIQRTFTPGELQGADWLIFTSQNGVEAFFENLEESGLDVRSLWNCQAAAIGAKTAEALRKKGILADLMPARFDSDALAEALKERLTGKETVWYPKAANADSHLQEALEGSCAFVEIPVYENRSYPVEVGKEAVEVSHRTDGIAGFDAVLFTCASSAQRLIHAFGKDWGQCRAYSIGPKTTACLRANGIEAIHEARQSTYEGLVECVIEHIG